MAGDDQIIGNLGVRGATVFGPSTQAITGLYAVRLSTYAPVVGAGVGNRIDLVPSTTFTFSTNDIVLGVMQPTTTTSTGSGIIGSWPTSSGGVAIVWTFQGGFTPSTGVYIVPVLRTT